MRSGAGALGIALFFAGCCMTGTPSPIDPPTRVAPAIPPMPPSVAETPETLARRERSLVVLRAEGVPISSTLPVLSSEHDVHLRTVDEVVDRAIALFVVGSRGAGDPPDYVARLAADFDAARCYSPAERAFMSDPAPDPVQASALSWRFESLAVMLWALGYLDALPRPDAPLDGAALAQILVSRGAAAFRAGAHLRSAAEILDAADLVYRYDWATTEARIHGEEAPAGLSNDVVMERHQSLNWLYGYNDEAWDDVSNDT